MATREKIPATEVRNERELQRVINILRKEVVLSHR